MAKSLLIAAALLGSADCFAPTGYSRFPTSINEATLEEPAVEEAAPFVRGYIGGEGPEPIAIGATGSVNFDPCGFAERAPEWVPWFREAELKHGRAAMLATLGFVVPEFVRVPGDQFSFENIPKVIEAHDKLPGAMTLIFGAISFVEACTFPALANMNEFDRAPGDYSFDPLGLYPEDPELQKERQLQELKNGRLAMIAIGGFVAQASITGNSFPYLN